MNIPILRLGNVLLASVQIDLSDLDAMRFQSDLVKQISETEAMGVLIDITSLDIVDSYLARIINDTSSMAKLLGAEVTICGVKPFVAMTLVELGKDLIGVDCAFNLEQGLKILNARIARRGDAQQWSSDQED
ncbi:STAS domain-containing protein [Limnobacter sp.]|uniref:STAS domain-containing protein n=1 Tax=Limnobacter sp. TaxID=2003368 RepID=UPI003517FAC1